LKNPNKNLHSNKSRLGKVLLGIAVVFSALLLLCWLSASSIAAYGIRYSLEKAGLEVVELQGVTLDSTRLTISQATLRRTSTSNSVLIVLQNLALNYSAQELLKLSQVYHAQLEPGAIATLNAETSSPINFSEIKLQLENGVPVEFGRQSKEIKVAPITLLVEPTTSKLGNNSINVDTARVQTSEFNCKNENCSGEIALKSLPVTLHVAKNKFEIPVSDAKISVRDREFKLAFNLKNVSGKHDKITFQKANAKIEANATQDANWQMAADVNIPEVNAGIPISNINFKTKLNNTNTQLLQIQNFKADIFGGKVSAKSIPVSLTGKSFETKLEIVGLNVEKILEVYPQEKLSGTGLIDGTLPVAISKQGIIVKDGTLSSRSPGLIRYAPDNLSSGLASTNQQFAVLLDALRNYHYSSLNLKVDYHQDGTLLLGVNMKGQNPDYNKGQAINLNLNIEENIPALIKSLQAGRNFKLNK